MFFAKKLISAFLSPVAGGMVILLVGLGLALTQRFRRVGLWVLAVGLAAGFLLGTTPVADTLIGPLERRYPMIVEPRLLPEAQGVRWVVVLGGGHTSDTGRPPPARLRPEALFRITEGVRLHRALPGSTLVLSGWSGGAAWPQAQALLDAAVAMGLDRSAAHLETDPRDTAEEAERIAALLSPGERLVLVTSAAHMPRAVYHFRARGLDPIPAPAQAYVARGRALQLRDFLPSGENYVKVERAAHEWLGLLWARLTIRR